MKLLHALFIIAITLLFLKIIYCSSGFIDDRVHINTYYSIIKSLNVVTYPDKLLTTTKTVHVEVPASDVIFFVCHDYEELPMYAQKSTYLTKEYCNIHGYSFLDIKYPKGSMSPYWMRVDALIKLGKLYPPDTIFIYMDLDACVNSTIMNRSIHDIISSLDADHLYDIYISKDISPLFYVNTGVVIIRNTEWSLQFVREWWSKYNKDNWAYDNNQWTCKTNNKKCGWAGDEYEQGQFSNLYQSNWNESKYHIGVLKIKLMANNYIRHKDTIIYHLMGYSNASRAAFFDELNDAYQSMTAI